MQDLHFLLPYALSSVSISSLSSPIKFLISVSHSNSFPQFSFTLLIFPYLFPLFLSPSFYSFSPSFYPFFHTPLPPHDYLSLILFPSVTLFFHSLPHTCVSLTHFPFSPSCCHTFFPTLLPYHSTAFLLYLYSSHTFFALPPSLSFSHTFLYSLVPIPYSPSLFPSHFTPFRPCPSPHLSFPYLIRPPSPLILPPFRPLDRHPITRSQKATRLLEHGAITR